tara:strand:- start:437 stop:634 length:198 start_codon:yes stop_codon:yes gene_type:complete
MISEYSVRKREWSGKKMTEGKKKGKGMEMKMKEDTYVKMSASSIFHHCCGHSVEENFYKSHTSLR